MATAKLTTLTPVHVGSGEKLLRNFDFIVQNGKVGFLDLKKVMDKIGYDRLPQLTAAIEKKEVNDFLRRALPDLKLEDVCSRVANNKTANNRCNELKEHYHTALLNSCIPGSSIKGSIKTAIWETLATKDKQQEWQVQDYKSRSGKFNSDTIDKKLFGPNANEKTTRFLKVGDVHFPNTTNAVYEVGILNAGRDDWRFKEGQSFMAECIAAGAISSFFLKLDVAWFKENKKYYPDKWQQLSTSFIEQDTTAFCALLNSYISRQLDYEINDLQDYGFDCNEAGEQMLQDLQRIKLLADKALKMQSPMAILRIGGNSGWNFTTGGWVKTSALSTEDYNAIRRTIQRGKTYDMDLWPKTRKLTPAGLPMGFVKIEF